MVKVQDYFDKKFQDMSRIMDLEKQLAENCKHLEELKVKGRYLQIDDETQSELTVYRNAVQKKREGSSSSEEDINTSGDDQNNTFDCTEREINRQAVRHEEDRIKPSQKDLNEASTSQAGVGESQPTLTRKDFAEARAEQLIKEVEAAKARAYEVSGNGNEVNELRSSVIDRGIAQIRNDVRQSSKERVGCHDVDDDYLLVASHLDETIRMKIIKQEYVDFSKLLRRDRPRGDDDLCHQKMVMINGGVGVLLLGPPK